MTILSSDTNKSHQAPPGDALSARTLISQYKAKLSEVDRFRGELESEKKRIDRDKASVKAKISSYGAADSAALRVKLLEINTQISGDFYKLESAASQLENEIGRLQGERGLWENQLDASLALVDTLKKDNETYTATLVFLRDVSEVARQGIVSKIETFVTKALEKIFGEGLLKFKIELSVKSNVPHAEFLLEDVLTGQSFSVLESFGGGVGDVVSTVLRLAMLEMQDPANTGPVALDEVGKFLSDDRQEKFGEFLRQWSEHFNRQIILITHKPSTLKHAHRVFKVTKDDSTSSVNEMGPNLETTLRTEDLNARSALMTDLLEHRPTDVPIHDLNSPIPIEVELKDSGEKA